MEAPTALRTARSWLRWMVQTVKNAPTTRALTVMSIACMRSSEPRSDV